MVLQVHVFPWVFICIIRPRYSWFGKLCRFFGESLWWCRYRSWLQEAVREAATAYLPTCLPACLLAWVWELPASHWLLGDWKLCGAARWPVAGIAVQGHNCHQLSLTCKLLVIARSNLQSWGAWVILPQPIIQQDVGRVHQSLACTAGRDLRGLFMTDTEERNYKKSF